MRSAHGQRERETAYISIYIYNDNTSKKTFSGGCLGSRNDEERSEMRYVMRIAESAFGRADVAVAVVATRGNGLRLLLVRRIARAVRRACCGRLKVVSYCSWASNQVRRPAEFKHITKRRKRN